eukprot:XP_001704019.1 Hypothetical protein GL50803_35598 [Giardia lamblia ATCC 50803]
MVQWHLNGKHCCAPLAGHLRHAGSIGPRATAKRGMTGYLPTSGDGKTHAYF